MGHHQEERGRTVQEPNHSAVEGVGPACLSRQAEGFDAACRCGIDIPPRPTLSAQWLKIKIPGIPRNSDGKPNLTASAPRATDGKPDLSGLWAAESNTYIVNLTGDLKPGEIRTWAEEVYKKRLEALDKDNPSTRCFPEGPVEILGGQYRIIQGPNVFGILDGSGACRQIFVDGRILPEDPNPTWWDIR